MVCMIFFNSANFKSMYSSQNFNSSAAKEAKQDLIKKNYNKIYTHELAHKTAGGSYAGAIVIEKNDEGIPVSGHVAIQMPTLNPANPQKTIDHANTVIRSAMAPSDPSNQDYRVAAQASAIKNIALNVGANNNGKPSKHLNYIA